MTIDTLQKDFSQIKKQFEVELKKVSKKVSKDAKREVEVYKKQLELKVKSLTDEAQKAAMEQLEKRNLKPVAEALLQRIQYILEQFEKDPIAAIKNINKYLRQPLKVSPKTSAKEAALKLAKKSSTAVSKKKNPKKTVGAKNKIKRSAKVH